MADTVFVQHAAGRTLYFQIWDVSGLVWNGSSFEAYSSGRWSYYDVALTQKGASCNYVAAFPAVDAGTYAVSVFEQAGVGPAESDPGIGASGVAWTGTVFVDVTGLVAAIAAVIVHGDAYWGGSAVLTNPSLKLACNEAGQVVASNMRGTDGANTTTPPAVEAIRTEMDANSTKLAAIVEDTNELQSDDVPGLIATAQSDLDKLTGADGATLATVQGLYAPAKAGDAMDLVADAVDAAAVKADAVAEIQSGLGTVANQIAIAAAIAALNDLDASEIASAVQDTVVDGVQTVQTVLQALLAKSSGKMVVDDSGDPVTFTYYADNDTTPVLVLSVALNGKLRTN